MRDEITRALLGASIRFYRRTPLHPRLGKRLARTLGLFVSLRSSDTTSKTIDGIRFELDLDEVIDSSLYFSGTFEPDTERLIDQYLAPGGTAIDVGANIGYHTLRMARCVGPSGSVLAVEPMPSAFQKLQRNGDLNSASNITYLQVAIGREDQGPIAVNFKSSYRLNGDDTRETSTVEMLSLDSLVQRVALERLDFLKIDVDGLELQVLQGSLATLRRFRPRLVLEVTPSAMLENGDRFEDLVALLLDTGNRFKTEQGKPIPDLHDFLKSLPSGLSANVFVEPTTA